MYMYIYIYIYINTYIYIFYICVYIHIYTYMYIGVAWRDIQAETESVVAECFGEVPEGTMCVVGMFW